jgi:hypothetical protein
MTDRATRTIAFRVSRPDRDEAHHILSSVPGFTVEEERLSSGAWGFVVLVCAKQYDAPDAAARSIDFDQAEAMLDAAGVAYRNLGPTRQDAASVEKTGLMAVSRATGERYGRIVGRRHDEVRAQLQRLAELYDIPLNELDILPLSN